MTLEKLKSRLQVKKLDVQTRMIYRKLRGIKSIMIPWILEIAFVDKF